MMEGQLCRDCGNRTKPFMHHMGWCLVKEQPVSLVIPWPCDAFTARGKAQLQEPTVAMLELADQIRRGKRK